MTMPKRASAPVSPLRVRPHAACDLHVHSKYSDHPSEWFLRRIGAPESFMEPRGIYRRCKEKGMDFVTITDHNTLDGALEIAGFPDTFLSVEATTYFPEDGCKIHCLACGITEAQFKEINAVRENIYDLRNYLVSNRIVHSVAHPLFRVNGKLTVEHVEKLLLLFNRFEGINGSRHPRAGELVYAIFRNLTPGLIAELAARHGIAPLLPSPWEKSFTGGSDDHSGCYVADAHTLTPPAATPAEYLEHLRAGAHDMGGCCGTSRKLAHSIYHIAWQYYRERFLAGGRGGDRSAVGALLRRLAEGPAKTGWRDTVRHVAGRIFGGDHRRTAMETLLVQEFSGLVSPAPAAGPDAVSGKAPADAGAADAQAFRFACRIGHELGYAFVKRFADHLRKGELLDSLQAAAALGPVAVGIAPCLAAYSAQHKDEPFLQAVAARFPASHHLVRPSEKKAWVTDTFAEVNGVTRTIRTLGAVAKAQGRKLTVVTCMDRPPKTDFPVMNFKPVGTFKLPEYEMQAAVFPPFLDILQYFEREKFSEVIISTPGPLGLAALAVGRLLGLRVTGIYHTDFPLYARYLTHDEIMEQLTWRYMQWFFGQLDAVFVPSECYRQVLAEHGFDADKLLVMPRGVDVGHFTPDARHPAFWERFGVEPGFTFLYVGRISPEKNLEELLAAFGELSRGRDGVNLVLVGDGPALPALKKAAGRRVHFTGCLHGAELVQAYASADAFVFPSTTDTFGNAVLEAQACGLPAIVANRGGPQEIVGRHQSGLVVDLAEPGALAAAMARLLGDRALYDRMVGRALENARDSRWEAILDQFWQAEAAAADRRPEHAECLRIRTDPSAPAACSLNVA